MNHKQDIENNKQLLKEYRKNLSEKKKVLDLREEVLDYNYRMEKESIRQERRNTKEHQSRLEAQTKNLISQYRKLDKEGASDRKWWRYWIYPAITVGALYTGFSFLRPSEPNQPITSVSIENKVKTIRRQQLKPKPDGGYVVYLPMSTPHKKSITKKPNEVSANAYQVPKAALQPDSSAEDSPRFHSAQQQGKYSPEIEAMLAEHRKNQAAAQGGTAPGKRQKRKHWSGGPIYSILPALLEKKIEKEKKSASHPMLEIFERYEDESTIREFRVNGEKFRFRYNGFLPLLTGRPPKDKEGYVVVQRAPNGSYIRPEADNLYALKGAESELGRIIAEVQKKDIPIERNRGLEYGAPWLKEKFIDVLKDSRDIISMEAEKAEQHATVNGKLNI